MFITIRFIADIEILMGKREVTLALEDSRNHTIGEVIAEITRLECKDLRSVVMDGEGRLRGTVGVVLNDELLLQDTLEKCVKNRDVIVILPLIAGG